MPSNAVAYPSFCGKSGKNGDRKAKSEIDRGFGTHVAAESEGLEGCSIDIIWRG